MEAPGLLSEKSWVKQGWVSESFIKLLRMPRPELTSELLIGDSRMDFNVGQVNLFKLIQTVLSVQITYRTQPIIYVCVLKI